MPSPCTVESQPGMPPSSLKEYYEINKENKMLMITFGFKREGVKEEWRKIHNEQLHNLYFSANIITMVK
jgi:hypothetical protein